MRRQPSSNFNNLLLWVLPAFLIISCSPEAPVLTSIDPRIGRMGEFITLTGSNFGESHEESYVTIAGISPTSSSYQLWQDNIIIVRVPELGESGLVYVHARGKKSNGLLFSNYAIIPKPVDGEEFGFEPRITAISPQVGVPGSVVVITGSNFGVSRENAGVFFSWDFDSNSINPYVVRETEYIEVSEVELGYESWSAREIRVRLPDGAVSGNIEVRTPHGSSRPVYFDVTGKPGIKNFTDKRIYTITYSVDIRVLEATRPNSLYLWVPKPITSPSQRNVSLISRNAEPFIENHRGVSIYKLENLGTSASQTINFSFRLEVLNVESSVRPAAIRQEATPLSSMYTQSTALIPSDVQQIRTTTNAITGREQNPYLKARAIYDWILTNIQITETSPPPVDLLTALEQRQMDSYSAALLFTTMARVAGIPCIPIAGILISHSGQTLRHYWAEFWIDGFGWIPVDPVMGANAIPEFIQRMSDDFDTANYYFGNMDNQRIAFSRGDILLSQMENRGRVVSHQQSYSLQNIWEEATGGLESYSSFWSDIIISGIYSQ